MLRRAGSPSSAARLSRLPLSQPHLSQTLRHSASRQHHRRARPVWSRRIDHWCGAGISDHRATARAAATFIETTRGLLIDGNNPVVLDNALACCSDRATPTASSPPRLILRLPTDPHWFWRMRTRSRNHYRRDTALERSIAARVMIPAIKQTGQQREPEKRIDNLQSIRNLGSGAMLNLAARSTKPRTRCRARLSTTAKLGDRTRLIAACTARGADANRDRAGGVNCHVRLPSLETVRGGSAQRSGSDDDIRHVATPTGIKMPANPSRECCLGSHQLMWFATIPLSE